MDRAKNISGIRNMNTNNTTKVTRNKLCQK